jgi:hypothetical protein
MLLMQTIRERLKQRGAMACEDASSNGMQNGKATLVGRRKMLSDEREVDFMARRPMPAQMGSISL